MLHDIGKLSTPDAILHKAGPLTEAEWEVMHRHPVDGERLISSTPGLEYLAPAIRAAHERWDGAGYPDRLAGAQIPIASRITLACDAYNAMVSDRAYRRALPTEAARRELSENAGSQFDPVVAEALLGVLEVSAPTSH
jgi:HD-GYP domain-containing protein (c-di-GMP phosphodiesterase class II)